MSYYTLLASTTLAQSDSTAPTAPTAATPSVRYSPASQSSNVSGILSGCFGLLLCLACITFHVVILVKIHNQTKRTNFLLEKLVYSEPKNTLDA